MLIKDNSNNNNNNNNTNNNNSNNSNSKNIIKLKGYHISAKNTFFKVLEDVCLSKRDDWVVVDSHIAPVGNNFNETLELLNNQNNSNNNNNNNNNIVPLIYTNLSWERNDSITFIRNQIYFQENECKKLYDNCRSISSSSIIRNAISNYSQLTDKYILYKNLLNSNKSYVVPTILVNKGRVEAINNNSLESSTTISSTNNDSDNGNLWYLKDPLKNKSEGIHLFTTKNQALEFSNLPENKEKRFLLQKEIAPMLIDQYYKFDVRVFIVIVFTSNYTKCYMFNEGIVRSTNSIYQKGSANKESQLTNYCYQKQISPEFHRIYRLSDINKSQLDGIDSNILFEKTKECTSNYISGIITKLNHLKHYGFTLFGLDYIFDNNVNPFLLEINYSPSPFQNSPNNVPLVVQELCKQLPFITFDPLLDNKLPILNNFIEINSINYINNNNNNNTNNNNNSDNDSDDFELFQ